MHMNDWLKTIDDYLKMTRGDILTTKGKVIYQQALGKAQLEYEKYKRNYEYILFPMECYFIESIWKLEKLDGKINSKVLIKGLR